jgi:hypothetical protein
MSLMSRLSNSSLSQNLTLTPGAVYTASYWVRNDWTATDNFTATNNLVLSVGTLVVDEFLGSPAFDWQQRSLFFTAPAGPTPLTFTFRQVMHSTESMLTHWKHGEAAYPMH